MDINLSSSIRRFFLQLALCIVMIPGICIGAAFLPAYDADLTQTSVSGLSSGGFMAAQFEVAFSKSLVGAGIVAGGPFYCAGSYKSNSFLVSSM